jgi:hypothetical protein
MVKPGERYLVDASGRPFLIHGDRAVTVDLGQIAAAHWYDPSNGLRRRQRLAVPGDGLTPASTHARPQQLRV